MESRAVNFKLHISTGNHHVSCCDFFQGAESHSGQEYGLWNQIAWAQILVLLANCTFLGTLCKPLWLSFLLCEIWVRIILPSQICYDPVLRAVLAYINAQQGLTIIIHSGYLMDH